ncbi:hypothetical protein [Clostridium butyricum]|uniref:hypothetical protein n=1 Tax=Clostridium butyricum TaxID=1492 RepID=UPI002AB2A18D|nr:hypothetical protein [Clostridium butyricum]
MKEDLSLLLILLFLVLIAAMIFPMPSVILGIIISSIALIFIIILAIDNSKHK